MRVQVNDVRLYVDVEGAQLVPKGAEMRRRPTVLALHGGPGADHSTLKPALSPLAAVAQLVYVDYRGHGRSDDGPRARWSLNQLADDVVGLCAALEIEHPIVYGQSLGAIVALTYASRHPDHPRALLLVAASAVGYGLTIDRVAEAFRRVGGDKAAEAYRRDAESPSAESHEEWMRHCFPFLSKRSDAREVMDQVRSRIVQRPYDIHECLNTEMRAMDLRPQLTRVSCPTLLLVGEDDPETPPEDSEEIADLIGRNRAQVARVPEAAHTVLRDQPEVAHQAMHRFLAELPVVAQPAGCLGQIDSVCKRGTA